jgi:hypothetical protein
MLNRLMVFMCGVLLGCLLGAVLAPGNDMAAGAGIQARGDARCSAHPLKMPCLFERGP